MGFEDSLPFFGMLMVILIQVGNMEVSKAAMSAGMNKYILAVYSNALPTLILLPLSFICCRSQRPPVTFSVLCRIFLLALIGCSGQILEYAGIQYSSPTLCTAMLNLIPAFTFMLAIIFRMEKLEWSSSSSQAKLLGTIVSITGASVVTFYKGPPIMMTPSSSQLLLSPQSSWILGGILLTADAFSYSAWYIVQASILKIYPAVLVILFHMFFYNTILSAVFTLIIVRDPDAWRLRLDMGLVAILYTGVVSSVLRVSLCTWCLSRTGPFFCSMFKPVAIIFAVVMDVFLGDVLCLGSVIGAAVTVVGFYAVMWGKANEEKMYKDSGVASFGSSSEKIPLLQNRMEEI
ncbi:WAT1-related protein At5g40240-like isoform X2 [Alnus glutinosa]|uniref:WAT1-related protein At5g40240-like isoform X2 n=1 Tax=Alnus glutinosa TaxID=3517 RepID=UPI002D783652|nr:WAT1-related protein At5g40240-like isoform X2 [Alnus glutinosa]